jgi:hypothetical protein
MALCGIIYILSSINIYNGVQAILKFFFRNLKDCNVGISGWRDL